MARPERRLDEGVAVGSLRDRVVVCGHKRCVCSRASWHFGALFGLIGAIIGVPIAAALQIVVEELTAGRRGRIAAADAAERTQ